MFEITEDRLAAQEALKAYRQSKNEEEMDENLIKCVQAYSNVISAAVNPIRPDEVTFLIFVIEAFAESLKSDHPKDAEFSDLLKRMIHTDSINVKFKAI